MHVTCEHTCVYIYLTMHNLQTHRKAGRPDGRKNEGMKEGRKRRREGENWVPEDYRVLSPEILKT